MKHILLSKSARDLSRVSTNLNELDSQTVARLTSEGPVLPTGHLHLAEPAFDCIPKDQLWKALALHECGHAGACDQLQIMLNQVALGMREHPSAVYVSRWFVGDIEFSVATYVYYECTLVEVSPDTLPAEPENNLSVIRLGDIQIEDTLWPVPADQYWFAIREHEMGSLGDSSSRSRPASFPLGETHESLWKHPYDEQQYFTPFVVETHLSEPRVTWVYSLTDEAPF